MKRQPKEHTGSFFLERAILRLLSAIAQLEGQSRGVIVERMVRYYLLEQRGKSGQRSSWERAKCAYKTKKKVYAKNKGHQRFQRARAQGKAKQKPFTQAHHPTRFRTIPTRELVSLFGDTAL